MRALDRVDAAIGGGIEHAMIHHHMRRLKRHGQLRALAPATEGLWAETAVPPRAGNSMQVLIDGANALPRMAEAIQGAKRHVHVCSWHLEPDFDPGPRKASPVKELLAEVAERVPVRVIVWAGAPVPVFQPRRATVKAARERMMHGTKIQVQLDSCTRLMHCHHEKLVIVDDEIAFVGGIDLTTLAGDRYDTNEHAFKDEIGWHDASAMLRGPIVRDVAAHFALRWEATADEALEVPEAPPAAGETTVQFVRTVPEGAYRVLPRGEFSVLETYIRALRSAKRLIYLENQFLWSPEIVHILETKLQGAAFARLPRGRAAPAPGQQRPGRHARDARPARRGRRRPQAVPGRHDHVALGRAIRAAVRARQDRDRRRRVARDRQRQPQRALAVQRHRGRRRHLRPDAGPRHARDAVGGAPRARGRVRRPGAADRRGVAPDRVRAARAPAQGRAAHAPPRRAAGRVAPLAAAARAARRARSSTA